MGGGAVDPLTTSGHGNTRCSGVSDPPDTASRAIRTAASPIAAWGRDRNQILNILARRYEKREDEKLNLLISYEDKRKLEDLEVIDAYVREYKSYPTNKYNYITIETTDRKSVV